MSVTENLSKIEDAIGSACEKSGRPRDSVQLIAVSKTKPNAAIQEAIDAGQLHFGENKVQELIEKQAVFPEGVKWHLIGHLQKNKIRKVLPACDLLHTLDSVALADRVDRISGELELKTEALIQVNISHDEAKFGFSETDIKKALPGLLEKPNIEIRGLMTIPVFDPDPEKTREHFANLRKLRNHLAGEFNTELPELSMGMSHDFTVAIEEGATLIRVGSSIFGKRE